MSVLMLSRREAYASKREVGETVLYTRDIPGLVFIIAHCSRAIPVLVWRSHTLSFGRVWLRQTIPV